MAFPLGFMLPSSLPALSASASTTSPAVLLQTVPQGWARSVDRGATWAGVSLAKTAAACAGLAGFGAALRRGRPALARRAARGARVRRAAAGDAPGGIQQMKDEKAADKAKNYVPLLIKMMGGEGKTHQVEARLVETVAFLKTAVQVSIGIPEDAQELQIAGVALEDDFRLEEYGIRDGSTLTLSVDETKLKDEEGKLEIAGEQTIRVIIKQDISVTKTQRLEVDVPLDENMGDVKEMVFGVLSSKNKGARRMYTSADFKLVQLERPLMETLQGGSVGIRQVARSEVMKDACSAKDNNLKGGEELYMVHRWHCPPIC